MTSQEVYVKGSLIGAPEEFECEVCGSSFEKEEVTRHLSENDVDTFVCTCGESKFIFKKDGDVFTYLEKRGLENSTALQLFDELLEG